MTLKEAPLKSGGQELLHEIKGNGSITRRPEEGTAVKFPFANISFLLVSTHCYSPPLLPTLHELSRDLHSKWTSAEKSDSCIAIPKLFTLTQLIIIFKLPRIQRHG